MKLSIVIVSYNEKEYLPEAIESCLNQDCDFPFEIIIGDDGSDDGSIELIKQYQSCYPDKIRYFVMDRPESKDIIPALRVSNVIKRGVLEAKGQYITTMSGDDLLLDRRKVATQVAFLDANPDYASCYTDYKLFWEDGKEVVVQKHADISRNAFWSGIYVHISCFVYRNEVKKYLLDRFCDDTGMIFSVFKAGKSKHISRTSFGYRQRNTSIMHEADLMELNIIELALFQDVTNATGYEKSSLSRFVRPIKYVLANREKLQNPKYQKYLTLCSQSPNDYIGKLAENDSLSSLEKAQIQRMIHSGMIFSFVFRIGRKLETAVSRRLVFRKHQIMDKYD